MNRQCNDKNLISLIPDLNPKEPFILAGDTEDNSKGETYMVNFFDGKTHYTFRNTSDAVQFLIEMSDKHKRGVEVWFANLQYDLGNLFRDSQENLSMKLAGSRVITAKIYLEKVKFKDILNVISGASVKKLGAMIELEKLDHGSSFDNEYYCQRDTEIVYFSLLVFKKYLSAMNVTLKNTAAGTGFSHLISKYEHLRFNNFSEEEHEFMRAGYCGGRTEVFNTSKQTGEIYSYDIVSSYPYAMTKIPLMNFSVRRFTKKPKLENSEGMINCVVEAPKIDIPYLPLKHDNKLIFPGGVFAGTWTYFEIREALKLGYKIKKVINALEFSAYTEITLADFVESLFAQRKKSKKEKNQVMDYCCKILLNASYGKFALGNEVSELVTEQELLKSKGNFTAEKYPNGQYKINKTQGYSPTTNYLIAAYITAYGRHNLFDKLSKAHNGGVLLYCDTDSVFYAGPKSIFPDDTSGNLGSFELQYQISEAHFILPKTYYVKTTDGKEFYRCKGVRENLAREFFTKGFAKSMQPQKYVETCRKNFFIKARNEKFGTNEKYYPFNLWVEKPKTLKSKYNKRVTLKNGKTRPIKLNFDIETNEYF